MQIFKSNKILFWTNELKGWITTIALIIVLHFGLSLIPSMPKDIHINVLVIMASIRIFTLLTSYYIKKIGIDRENKQLKFRLYSHLYGVEIKTYQLDQVKWKLVHHSGLSKYLASSVTLEIQVTPKDRFRINTRYGFSAKTLETVDKTLKELSMSDATS